MKMLRKLGVALPVRPWLWTIGLVGVAGSAAQAQTSPGQLLQDIQHLQPQPALPVPKSGPGLDLIVPEPAPPGQFQFVVKAFVFEGQRSVSSDEALQALLAGLRDVPITYGDLRRGTEAIAALYRQQGRLVRAVLPPQDITEGHVTIRIIEARLGDVTVVNRSQRVSDAQVRTWVYDQVPQGQAIDLDRLDQAVLTLDDLPDVNASGSLQEGQTPGQTTLLIGLDDEPRYTGMAMLDGHGDPNTGKERLSAQLNLNGVTGLGEQINLYGLHTQGSDYARVGWAAPAPRATRGQRYGFYASAMDYRIASAAFSSARITGAAEVLGFEATDPVIRSRAANLVVSVNMAHNRFRNWSNGELNADRSYTSTVTQFGASGNRIDGWQGGGLSTASLMASMGSIDRVQSSDNNQVGGIFSKLRYGASRTQNLGRDLTLLASVSGQVASQNMDSSEQLFLGGPMNVRAYASGQGAASQGQLFTLELRQSLSSQWQLAAFYDEGHVQTWKRNPSTNNVDNHYSLRGAGLSAAWAGPRQLSLKAIWARRLGSPSANVSNFLAQNGGLDRQRLWLSASLPF